MPVDAARAKSLFLAASDLSDPAERAAYLERECGGDAELRARVEALLRANDDSPPSAPEARRATGAFAPEVPAEVLTTDRPGQEERVGAVIAGRYKLVEEIGEGGMGSVYMAQQIEPVRRAVAVKVIKAGMDSRAVLARFEAERQALAMMDHPNIARVLDAGTTESGRPFFVMELVRGVPITEFCDARKLTPRQRLELFVPVCEAIQHAHQKGLIHRDIKPSNVLVALYDDRPMPKVIDFGVAKAAGQPLTDRTLLTGFGAVVGTPEYMSPEQASLNNLDVDTRSDVYSLGVLLYELLTGTTPVDRKSLGKAALLEVLRIVRDVEAPRPSVKLSTIETLANVAANRGTEPAKLSKLMKGELDWVVLKALEKDRTRRYETANGLARDIQRYLADELVEARPPSTGYRLRKFGRKNRAALTTAVAIAVLLVAGSAVATWQAVRATRAEAQSRLDRDRAEESFRQARAAVDDYFTEVSESKLLNVPGLQPLRKDLLERALKYYQSFIEQRGGDPRVKAELAATHYRAAWITQAVGSQERAVDLYKRALSLYDELVSAEPDVERLQIDRAIVCNDLGLLLSGLNHPAEAMQFHQQALEAREKLAPNHLNHGRFQNELAKSHMNLGRLLLQAGKPAEALAAYQAALDLNVRWEHEPVNNLADFPSDLGRNFNDPRQIRADVANIYRNIGYAHYRAGRTAESLAAYQHAVDTLESLIREDPRDTGFRERLVALLRLIGFSHGIDGRQEASLAAYQHALEIAEPLAADNPAVAGFRVQLATIHRDIGRWMRRNNRLAEGRRHLEQAVAIQEKNVREEPKWEGSLAGYYRELGWVHRLQGDAEEAMRLFQRARVLDQKQAEKSVDAQYDLACDWAVSIPVVGGSKDARELTDAEKAERRHLGDEAMKALRQAADGGWLNLEHWKKDEDLDALRRRDDFKKLIADLEEKGTRK
jgi:serine/threonine protein kinase/tetratricopeptide (TPR) repeat protein